MAANGGETLKDFLHSTGARIAYARLMWITTHDRIRSHDSRITWLKGKP